MNISVIADMIRADPTVLNDVPGFRARMNLENVQQVVTAPVIVQQAVTITTSIAKMNGGPCTAADVQAANRLINAVQWQNKAQSVIDTVQAQVNDGTIDTLAKLKTAFQNAVNALS